MDNNIRLDSPEEKAEALIKLALCGYLFPSETIELIRTKYKEFAEDESVVKKPQTNADRIRAMTDEELANFIARQRGRFCNFKDPSEEEYPKVLLWLKSAVEA